MDNVEDEDEWLLGFQEKMKESLNGMILLLICNNVIDFIKQTNM